VDYKNKNILIIDDEPISSKSLTAILNAKGFEVKNTAFGKEGLEWLEAGFDIVILDLKLPDIDGLKVLETIRKKWPSTVVILISGNATVDNAVATLNKGAFAYLTKPFEVHELLDAIERGLKQQQKSSKDSRMLTNLSIVYQISKEMEGKIELHSIATLAASYLVEVLKLDVCAVLLFDEAKKLFTFGGLCGVDYNIEDLAEKQFKLEPGLLKRLAEEKNAILIPELKTTPDIIKFIPLQDPKSLFIFPLIAKDKLEGIALFVNRNSVALDDEDLESVTTISKEVAQCIENATRYLKLKHSYLDAVTSLVSAIESKDKYSKGHSEEVAVLAVQLGEKAELPAEKLESLRLAALLHDIGKIAVSEQILLKKEKLTTEEYLKLKMHSIVSTSIVRKMDHENKIIPIILYHHERYDGKGYPEGLSQRAIPLGARILSICDAYTAMIAKRPYRFEMTKKEAVSELNRCAGEQFDPELVKRFINEILNK